MISADFSWLSSGEMIKENISNKEQPVKPFSYSVIKHSLMGLSKYFSEQLAPYGIRVNLLAPGGVWNNGLSDEFINKLTEQVPMNRMANDNDYKGSIQFLCSDASSYMTGANLSVDGGRTTGSI